MTARSNAFWLTVAHLSGLVIPLIELPFLARALGPEAFGYVLFFQAASLTIGLVIEYGFHFNGARRIAVGEKDRGTCRDIVTGVTFAKLALAGICAGIAAFVLASVPSGREFWELTPWVMLMALANGLSPVWYFLGIGRLVFVAVFDIFVRALGLIMIVSLVREPEDFTLAIQIYVCVGLINTFVPSVIMLSRTGIRLASLGEIRRELVTGWPFFVMKGCAGVSASISTTILGASSSAREVGLFGPSEKIVRAANALVVVVLSAYFPDAVRRTSGDGAAARTLFTRALVVLFACMSLIAGCVALLASHIVAIIFGDGFGAAVPLLQVLAFLIPVRTASSALSVLWFIPTGREILVSRLNLFGLALVLTLGIPLSYAYGAGGMALALAAGEIVLLAALLLAFGRLR